MDAQDIMTTNDYIGAIACMEKEEATLESIMEQLRLARMKLGSILNRLDDLQLNSEDLDGIRGQAECITCEIDGLVVLIRAMLEH
ncbi:MAG TPA: hypothetical protein VH107_21165 [Lacipirellulaceae bacterium]|jgi:hypothetical protein|nr:hypothetical protein [Lacipirellulaceae bacterium]